MATSKRTTRAAKPGRATRKPAAAKPAARQVPAHLRALATALGKAWQVTPSTMANKYHLRYNGRTVVWLVNANKGAPVRASRRAIGLRPCNYSAAVAKAALAKLQRTTWGPSGYAR